MKYTINSKILGKKLTFSRPGSNYIFVDYNGKSGTLGCQPCYGGRFSGYTLAYSGDDIDEFKNICRNWYRSHIRLGKKYD